MKGTHAYVENKNRPLLFSQKKKGIQNGIAKVTMCCFILGFLDVISLLVANQP